MALGYISGVERSSPFGAPQNPEVTVTLSNGRQVQLRIPGAGFTGLNDLKNRIQGAGEPLLAAGFAVREGGHVVTSLGATQLGGGAALTVMDARPASPQVRSLTGFSPTGFRCAKSTIAASRVCSGRIFAQIAHWSKFSTGLTVS
jgi:hypothetical protein